MKILGTMLLNLKLNVRISFSCGHNSTGRMLACQVKCYGFDPRCPLQKYEPLAQSVEHLTFNQGVTGSIPVWLTKYGSVPQLVRECGS